MRAVYLFFSKYKILHILYWFYSGFEIWHNLRLTRSSSVFDVPDLINGVGCKMLCVYFIVYFLLPSYYYKKRFAVFTIGFVFVIVLSALLNVGVSVVYIKIISPERTFNLLNASLQALTHLISYTQAAVLFLIVFLIEFYVKKEQQGQKIEKERIESELNFLKAQLNPHFLFNALNSIYFLIDGNRERSKEVLIKFSDLIRYQLYDCSVQKTTLQAEANFLQDYIDLEKIRNNEGVSIEFKKSGNFEGFLISPLLLIPFVENAFKFVSHQSGQPNYIRIHISVNETGKLDFEVENSFSRTEEKAQRGLGINNVKRRLELLYPDLYNLKITEVESRFNVHLKLDLT